MKKILLFILFLSISKIYGQKKWYQGGTLHKSSLYEWKLSKDRNKLATTSDWVYSIFKKKGKQISLDDLKIKSIAIKKCTDERINKFKSINNLKGIKANEIAYKCMKDKKYIN